MDGVKKCLWLVLIVAVSGLMASGSFAEVKKAKKQVEIVSLKDIGNPNAEFTVELTVDRKDATYKVGDEIVFSFKTNKDCYLTLFHVTEGGKQIVLFPNEHQKDNRVKAETTYRIPPEGAKWMYKAKGPAGEDFVKAIATLDKVALVSPSDLKPAGDVQEVKKPESETAKQIEVALRPLPVKKWAEAEKILKVVE